MLTTANCCSVVKSLFVASWKSIARGVTHVYTEHISHQVCIEDQYLYSSTLREHYISIHVASNSALPMTNVLIVVISDSQLTKHRVTLFHICSEMSVLICFSLKTQLIFSTANIRTFCESSKFFLKKSKD